MAEEINLERALSVARDAAREAASLLREGRRGELRIEHKGAVDLVTEYDRRSELGVIERLRATFPDHRVVGEESGDHGGDGGADQPVWYIDPLDGTTNYAHRLPWYGVSLALELRGEARVGLVLAPEMGWEFSAVRGGGARLDGRPIRVSRTAELRESLIGTGFPYDRARFDNVDNVRAVLRAAQSVRRIGSAALDLCMVATGWLDGYWEFELNPWDMAAGALIVQEAGGRVNQIGSDSFSSRGASVIATNGLIHDALAEQIRPGYDEDVGAPAE